MKEPKRNILVPSDPIEMIGLRIDGEGYTNLVRRMWYDGAYLRAIALLMEGLKGLNWDVAKAILEGRMKLEGSGASLTAVPDNTPTSICLNYDVAAKRQENLIELARIGEQAMNPPVSLERPFHTPNIDAERQRDETIKEMIKTFKKP